MKSDKNRKDMIFIDALTDALGRSDGQLIEEVKDDLRAEGIDVDTTIKRLIGSVTEISMTAKRKQLDFAREKRLGIQSKQSEFIGKFAGWTRDKILSRIREISISDPAIGVAYRELNSKNTEDLISLLEDLEMLKYRSEHEKDSDE